MSKDEWGMPISLFQFKASNTAILVGGVSDGCDGGCMIDGCDGGCMMPGSSSTLF